MDADPQLIAALNQLSQQLSLLSGLLFVAVLPFFCFGLLVIRQALQQGWITLPEALQSRLERWRPSADKQAATQTPPTAPDEPIAAPKITTFPEDLAESLMVQNRLNELKSLCQETLSHSPNSVSAYWYLAMVYYHQQQVKEAEAAFAKVMQLNPVLTLEAQAYLTQMERNGTEKAKLTRIH